MLVVVLWEAIGAEQFGMLVKCLPGTVVHFGHDRRHPLSEGDGRPQCSDDFIKGFACNGFSPYDKRSPAGLAVDDRRLRWVDQEAMGCESPFEGPHERLEMHRVVRPEI